jgi:hypothetical protein
VAVDGAGNAYAVWEEAGEGGDSDVYFAWRPAGEGWTAQHKINDDTGRAEQWNPAIAVDAQGNVHVTWADARSGHAEIYAAYRSAGGTWEANVRLSDAGSKKHVRPVIAVDSQGSAYAAWQSYDGCAEAEPMGDIQFAMRPAGRAWGSAVTVSSDIGGTEVSAPAIAATSEAGTYLVWEEKSAGTYTLYSAYRTTTGTWEPKTKIAESAGNAAPSNPALAANAMGNAYVAWIDSRPGHSGLRFAMAVR